MIVAHASELPYVFGSTQADPTGAGSLGIQIIDYWLAFATSLDPNDQKGSQREVPSVMHLFGH